MYSLFIARGCQTRANSYFWQKSSGCRNRVIKEPVSLLSEMDNFTVSITSVTWVNVQQQENICPLKEGLHYLSCASDSWQKTWDRWSWQALIGAKLTWSITLCWTEGYMKHLANRDCLGVTGKETHLHLPTSQNMVLIWVNWDFTLFSIIFSH